jgi:hypothetical protein
MGSGWDTEDWDGESEDDWPSGWDDPKRTAWMDKWAPRCPIRNPQRVGHLLGYREREPGRLQLRVSMRPRTDGVCDAIVEETDDAVHVRVMLCFEDREDSWEDREYWDCPVHVDLERPLGDRPVITADHGEALPLFVPNW